MKNRHRALQIFLILSFFLIAGNAAAQSISIGSINGSQFCAGDTISVSFTATGSWGQGNAFILQLSNPSGSFSNGFQNIGSLVDTLPGTFTINISTVGVDLSTHYRFRILAANPPMTSTDNGSDITIETGPTVFFRSPLPADSTGTLITFPASLGDWPAVSDLNDTAFWDFGSGATPAKAITTCIISVDTQVDLNHNGSFFDYYDTTLSYSQAVKYSTPGKRR